MIHLGASSSTTANFAPSSETPLATLMLAKKPADLEHPVWDSMPYYLPGYMGVSGIQRMQMAIFDTTLMAYLDSPQSTEQKLLARLAAGEVIPEPETRNLFVGCPQCGAIFIKGCGKGPLC
ncbi:hypothetical protein B0H14DRAFT_2645514 [Mycena olivaceomarginata]|nr:hypothetical protein B0H14DRAFT_2645514 [Mycena olivaceomarginata]